jgi:hypothetical protein
MWISHPIVLVADLHPAIMRDDSLVKRKDSLVTSLQPTNLEEHNVINIINLRYIFCNDTATKRSIM